MILNAFQMFKCYLNANYYDVNQKNQHNLTLLYICTLSRSDGAGPIEVELFFQELQVHFLSERRTNERVMSPRDNRGPWGKADKVHWQIRRAHIEKITLKF